MPYSLLLGVSGGGFFLVSDKTDLVCCEIVLGVLSRISDRVRDSLSFLIGIQKGEDVCKVEGWADELRVG